ncbi:hypothetical protein [Haliea sp. E17]|uniref:hypothetical protein n=1 Tax=Haliea sp. E17 TaxID=3401576 RepID=UPI003AAF3A68
MILRPRQFLSLAAAVFFAVVVAIGGYHYRADRWGVFAGDFRSFHEKIIINKLYLKAKYLLSTTHDYDCFMFGSSRLAAVDARHFGDSCYNFTHSAGLLPDHLRAIRLLLDSGLPVRRVYIAIDDLSYNENPADGERQRMRRAYPESWPDALGFANLYLMQPPSLTDLALVTRERPKIDTPRFIVDPNLDTDRIRRRYQKYYDHPGMTDIRFRRLDGMGEGSHYYGDVSLAALRELLALAQERHIDVQLFFMPLHYKTYLSRNYDWFYRFKRGIAELQPFLDFSGLNPVTTDNRYWRETSHFSAMVGDRMAADLNGETARMPQLGRKVTPATLDAGEAAQLRVDASWMPQLLQREGMLAIPPRLFTYWDKRSQLQARAIAHQPPLDPQAGDPLERREIRFERGDDGRARTSELGLELRAGEYFVLEFELDSALPESMTLRMTRDRKLYGSGEQVQQVPVAAGSSLLRYAGYASVDRPRLRINLGGGNLAYHWRALRLLRLDAQQGQAPAAAADATANTGGGHHE